jgi:hypothetical protein
VRLAADTFREAIAADPNNPVLHLGAGMAAVVERRDPDAKEALETTGGIAVANLLRDLGRGEESNAAFQHRIQRSFADFQSALSLY